MTRTRRTVTSVGQVRRRPDYLEYYEVYDGTTPLGVILYSKRRGYRPVRWDPAWLGWAALRDTPRDGYATRVTAEDALVAAVT